MKEIQADSAEIRSIYTELVTVLQQLGVPFLTNAASVVSTTVDAFPDRKKRSLALGGGMILKKEIIRNPAVLHSVIEYMRNGTEALKYVLGLKQSLALASPGGARVLYHGDTDEVTSPFEGSLSSEEFRLAFEHHRAMLKVLYYRKIKLHKKLRSIKSWRKSLKRVFRVTCVFALIASLLFAVLDGGTNAAAATAAAGNVLRSMEELVEPFLAVREEALQGEHGAIVKLLDLFVTEKRDCFDVLLKNEALQGEHVYLLSMTNTDAIAQAGEKGTKTKPGKDGKDLASLFDICIWEMATMITEFLKIILTTEV